MAQSLRWTPTITAKRSRLMAAMSYLGILCFVPLLYSQDDEFISFHARQGLVIWAWGVLAVFTLAIPGLGWLFTLSSSIIVIMSAMGFVSSVLLQKWRLPFVASLADRL